MIELSEENVQAYLRGAGKASMTHDLLIQSLSGGVSNVVLKIFDPGAGEKVGTDMRSPAQIKRGVEDKRMAAGDCFVVKQPLPKFKTAAEWLVDIDRIKVERDCAELLTTLLPAGSVPKVLWFDDENYILAIACAPTESVIWKKDLLAGKASRDAAVHAGMLLAMMHSSTLRDAAVQKRYGDIKLFIQQRIDPYIWHTAKKHPDVAAPLGQVASQLEKHRVCLIHGDFSPKNIFLVPEASPPPETPDGNPAKPALSHLMLLDFEVAFYGDPAFDVATLVNHLLLKGFYHHGNWRGFMVAADAFWQTYMHTADKEIVAHVSATAGRLLGALLLARVDGKSPAEYLVEEPMKARIRAAGKALLNGKESTLDWAMDEVSAHFETPA